MNLLVATGTLITFIYSIYSMLAGGETYFETSCLLISFISLGEYIEDRAKKKSNDTIEGLLNLVPKKVRLIPLCNNDEDIINSFINGDNFELNEVSSLDAKAGDYVFIGEGESIPVDAQIILGEARVDESMLTGESDLVVKKFNDEVTGGTKLIKGQIIARVTHSIDESTLAKIINAVIDSQNSKAPVARIADKIAGIFVPAVLILAVITFVL